MPTTEGSGTRRFEGRVAIVTGAGRGIGLEYATALAREGAAVCIAEIDEANAQAAAKQLTDRGGRVIAVRTDVSDEDSVNAMVRTTVAELGGVDYLVNNAGLYGDRVPWDALTGPIEYWDTSIAVNLTSVLLCTRAVVPHLRERGGGAIVNQSSVAAYVNVGAAQYSVTKMGVISLTHFFAKLLGSDGIRVNAIAPGMTETDAYRKQVIDRVPDVERSIIEGLPLARRATPADQAAAVLFLLSDDASYITGQVLRVDGGMIVAP